MPNSKPGFDENSPQWLLWQQQQKAASLKNAKSMKWHPVLIRWCLSIYLKSPGTYNHLRQSGFLQLPHKSTLNNYTSFTTMGTGFNPDILEQFVKEIDLDNMKDYETNICILFDEMEIKSGLVFSKSSGKMIGFTDLGDINNELKKFGDDVNENRENSNLATHVLAFMAQDLSKRFNFPIGYYSSVGFDSDQLYFAVWEAVKNMEILGLKVRALVCDGASPNRRFFKIHKMAGDENVSSDGVVFWTRNRYDRRRKIFFISDVPHLIKTLRNNLENSHAHNNTRNLIVNGMQISWQHIIDVYEWDIGMNRSSPGLRKMPKLTEEHINLNPRLRMRVNLAAQVLSKTVADSLSVQGLHHTKSTEQFIRYVNTFFDCLNVSQTYVGTSKRNSAFEPFRQKNDCRLQWLENDFLKYINDWKAFVDGLTDQPKESRNKMCLSQETIDGIRITVRSFLELVPILLDEGFEYVLSAKLNQDAVEEHFSKQRMRGGGLDNPNLEQYGFNERKIVLAKSHLVAFMNANTRGREKEKSKIDINDMTPLLKKPKPST